jgi:hypothetical protein
MRFFGAADQRSLHFLATWCNESKGPEPFREFIGDAHHGRAPRIRRELQNGRLAGTRILLRVRDSLFLS